MILLSVTIPIACWRKGHAREFWESHALPPPSTAYGFLLSLVGEEDRHAHLGARVTAGLIAPGERSVVLRTTWRVKDKKTPRGTGQNVKPEFQELRTATTVLIACDSGDESVVPNLETRVRDALQDPVRVARFGGLSLGESTHLVNDVSLLPQIPPAAQAFVLDPQGALTLPVWVDHVGSAGTRYAVGTLRCGPVVPADLPCIEW